MTALYHESKTVEDWEVKEDSDLEQFDFDISQQKETVLRTMKEFEKLDRKVSPAQPDGIFMLFLLLAQFFARRYHSKPLEICITFFGLAYEN